MTNEEKAKRIAEYWKIPYPNGMDSYQECYNAAMDMAKWKDTQNTNELNEAVLHPQGSNLILHKEEIELQDMKGYVTRSILSRSIENNREKELIAITVISANDYRPHTIMSVRFNGQETAFGTDTKKAIEFYNQQ